jgi:predicted AAA+ superfamily ATPase
MKYNERVTDLLIRELLDELPAIAVEGAKAVGKTETTKQYAKSIHNLDDANEREIIQNNFSRVSIENKPILFDEWQRLPETWDFVRRQVDNGTPNGSYILTGSFASKDAYTHSGAGRIVRVKMRPFSLQERFVNEKRVSLFDLFVKKFESENVDISTKINQIDYINQIYASGFPYINSKNEKAQELLLNGYIDNIINHEIIQYGVKIRQPNNLLNWLKGYSAAIATDSSYTEILDASTPGESDKPSRLTTNSYRSALSNMWLIEEIPYWSNGENYFSRLKQTPKHYLVDPSLAVNLLDINKDELMNGLYKTVFDNRNNKYKSYNGRLFESLIAQSLLSYCSAMGAKLYHFRETNGDHEIDFIVEHKNYIVPIEVKFSNTITDNDVKHLNWFEGKVGNIVKKSIVISTGNLVYERKKDNILVIPACNLGV